MKKKNGETWYQSHLVDQELHQLLEKVDADLAQEACQKGCLYCRGKLHRADYGRKPRGGPQWERRYSYCCAEEDCRRRRTPESVRFLGRRVYAGLVVVVAMLSSKGATGVTGAGFITLAATLSVVPSVPIESLAILVGIDRFMSECRALTNLIGNGVATIVVSRWEKELDKEVLNLNLRKPKSVVDLAQDEVAEQNPAPHAA